MDHPAASPESLNGGRRWLRLLQGAFALVVAAWLVHVLLRADLSLALGHAARDPRAWLLVGAWAVLPTGLALLWRAQIRLVTSIALDLGVTYRIQALGWAGRYLPGKAGLWIAKIGLLKGRQIGTGPLLSAVITEQVLFVLAGAAVGTVLLVLHADAWLPRLASIPVPAASRWLQVLVALAALSIGIGAVAVLARIRWRDWIARLDLRLPHPRHLALLMLGHAMLHLVIGLATWALLERLLPGSAAALGLWGTVGAVALANVAGIAAVFAPAGLGIREVVLAFFLAGGSPLDAALSFAALSRALSLIADTGFSVLAWGLPVLLKRKHRPDRES